MKKILIIEDDVETLNLLQDVFQQEGYEVENILLAREIRASSQQMIELKSEGGLMRESIIILRKP